MRERQKEVTAEALEKKVWEAGKRERTMEENAKRAEEEAQAQELLER